MAELNYINVDIEELSSKISEVIRNTAEEVIGKNLQKKKGMVEQKM